VGASSPFPDVRSGNWYQWNLIFSTGYVTHWYIFI